MQHNCADLITRFNRAMEVNYQMRGLYETAYKYALPNRNEYDQQVAGADRNSQVLDTTLIKDANALASKLMNYITPMDRRWAKLVAGSEVPETEVFAINQQLETITDVMFKYIYRSNFTMEMSQSYYDLEVGTLPLIVNRGPNRQNPLIYTSVLPKYIALEEGPHGSVQTVWRKMENLKGATLQILWPKIKMTANMMSIMAQDPLATFTLIEGTVAKDSGEGFDYVVISEKEKCILYSEEMVSTPWVVGRWKRGLGPFGIGPIIDALPTAKTLNKIAEFEMKAGALAIAPPFLAASDQPFNPFTYKVQPNKVIPVNKTSAGDWPMKQLEVGGNLRFAQMQVSDLRQQIHDLMYTSPLGPMDTANLQMTATQANIRDQANLEEIGPAIGRIKVEVLEPLIKRTFYILQTFDLMPSDIEIDGKKMTIDYEANLTNSQSSQELAALMHSNSILQAIVGPQNSQAAYNPTLLPAYIFSRAGSDINLVKTPAELEQMAQQAAQAQAQQQQSEQAQQMKNPNVPSLPSPQQSPASTTGLPS